MYLRNDSGIYTSTREGDKEFKMHELYAPLIQADLVSSVSQVLSPYRSKELRSLAEIVRDTAEPHIKTTIPNDLQIRTSRSVENHPHIQAGLKVELMYAYWILFVTDKGDKKNDYFKEVARLEREVINEVFKEKNLFMHATLSYLMRTATIYYFNAAGIFVNEKDRQKTKNFINPSLQNYQRVESLIKSLQSTGMEKLGGEIRSYGVLGVPKIAEQMMQEWKWPNIKVNNGSMEELVTMLYTDQFNGLLQDVLFGKMRCYALQGNKKEFMKTSEELSIYVHKPGIPPAPIITQSCVIMMDDFVKNLKWKGYKLKPFISDSPEIMLKCVEDMQKSFGKINPGLWKPGDNIPRTPLIL